MSTQGTPIEAIPPTQAIRNRLHDLLRETAITRRLLKIAEKRDQMQPRPKGFLTLEAPGSVG